MSWFGNRNREGHEAETPEVKPRNQILQTPEKETPESKEKPTKSWELSPEQKKKQNDWASEVGKKYSDDRNKLKRPQGDADFRSEREVADEKPIGKAGQKEDGGWEK